MNNGSMNNDNLRVIGPEHAMFGASEAWYVFGVFSPDQSVRKLMIVKAKNEMAINMLESLTWKDGTISNTCALIFSTSSGEPQVRSTVVEDMSFVDFVLDMVDPSRWLGFPLLASMFNMSLSDVERVAASLKLDSAIRYEMEKLENRKNQEGDQKSLGTPETPGSEKAAVDGKLDNLRAGLTGLGFQRRDVQRFIDSIEGRTDPVDQLLMEGIKKLNAGRKAS